jgi:hypothetical protein
MQKLELRDFTAAQLVQYNADGMIEAEVGLMLAWLGWIGMTRISDPRMVGAVLGLIYMAGILWKRFITGPRLGYIEIRESQLFWLKGWNLRLDIILLVFMAFVANGLFFGQHGSGGARSDPWSRFGASVLCGAVVAGVATLRKGSRLYVVAAMTFALLTIAPYANCGVESAFIIPGAVSVALGIASLLRFLGEHPRPRVNR